jgi:hypothetical protein
MATGYIFLSCIYERRGLPRTVGETALVCLGGIPPGVRSVVGLFALLPALGLAGMSISGLTKELVDLERVGSLLIKVASFLKLGSRRIEPSSRLVSLFVGLLKKSLGG